MAGNHTDVLVLGAGLAGLMAAICCARRGRSVRVLEQAPEPLMRYLISGSGAAPLSNRDTDISRFHGRHARFASDALSALPSNRLEEWFNEIGISLTTEADYGMLVAEGGGEAVRDAMLAALEEAGGELHTSCPAWHVQPGFKVNVGDEVLGADSLVLTGAASHADAASLGHRVAPALPAHAGLAVEEAWVSELDGLWMDVQLTLHSGQREVLRREGSMLFTLRGLSGQVIFNISGEVAQRQAAGERLALRVDFFPAQSRDEVGQWLHRTLGEGTRERALDALDRMLPWRLAEVLLRPRKLKPGARSMHLELRDREFLLEQMTATRLTIDSVLQETAESNTGGVNLREVNPRTMESRLVPGTYVTGGALDLAADWGGIEQHFELASGWLAGGAA